MADDEKVPSESLSDEEIEEAQGGARDPEPPDEIGRAMLDEDGHEGEAFIHHE